MREVAGVGARTGAGVAKGCKKALVVFFLGETRGKLVSVMTFRLVWPYVRYRRRPVFSVAHHTCYTLLGARRQLRNCSRGV